MLRRCGLGLVVLGLAVLPVHAQVKLEWKFQEGEKFYLETVTNMKQLVKVMGNEQNVEMGQTQLVAVTVKKKNSDGSVVLEQVIDSVKVDGQMAQFVEPFLEKMKGAVITVTLNANGRVSRVEGFEEMMKKIGGGNPLIDQMLKGVMSEDVMKKQYDLSFGFLPEKAVKPGDTWQMKAGIPLGPLGEFITVNDFTYAGKAESADKITAKVAMTYAPPKENQPGGLFQVTKGNLKGESSDATYLFDSARGKLVQSEMKMRVKGSMTISAMGQELEMDMEQDQTQKVRLLDKKP